MEQLLPPPPLTFSGSKKRSYENWKQRFDLYFLASGADKRLVEDQKKALLLHCIGEEGLQIYNSFENKEDLKYEEVLLQLEAHCSPPTNETYNRHLFFSRRLRNGEQYEEYLTALKHLSLDCKFENLKDSLIRDQIILGMNDDNLREKLLRIPDLTLDKCMNICKTAQVAQSQLKNLNNNTNEVGAVTRNWRCSRSPSGSREPTARGRSRTPGRTSFVRKLSSGGTQPRQPFVQEKFKTVREKSSEHLKKDFSTARPCGKCNKFHGYAQCPAFGKKCMKCNKLNHFASCCTFKCSVVNSEKELQYRIDTVCTTNVVCKEWYINIKVDSKNIKFKIDTGSHVDIMNKNTMKQLLLKLYKCRNVRLTNFDGSRIKILGACDLKLRYKGNDCLCKFFVVNFDTPCILSYSTALRLGIINNVSLISKNDVVSEYSELFKGLGELKYEYDIKLKENCIPIAERPRKIPFKLQDQIKIELDKLENLGVIRKVNEPTEWVNSMVIAKKSDGSIRLCLDPQNLNKYIIRERFKMSTFEELVARMPNAKYFSVLDASKSFYMIKLSEKSQLYTTFNAGDFGRYCYKRLPFGLNSAPEVFSKCFHDTFSDIKGVEQYVDELLVWGESKESHDKRLRQVLNRAKETGVKFNKDKCQFGVTEVKYVGHILSSTGIRPDTEKIRAIVSMKEPTNKKELQTFLGIVTYISKFIPNLSDITNSLRELVKKDSIFVWGKKQEEAFNKIKQILTTEPVLQFFETNSPIILSVDSSSTGLGAVLLQHNAPVAYASKALTESQKTWAQIEKELLAIVYACEKFHQFIYGKQITVETDHKPLEQIFKKSMNETPLRLQKLRMRIQGYDLCIKYRPGKELLVADALSRSYVQDSICNQDIDEKIEMHVCMIIENLSISENKLKIFQEETSKDQNLLLLINYIQNDWPKYSDIPFQLKFYHSIKESLSVASGLIFKDSAVLVPKALRSDMLRQIHYNHMGYEKCKNRIKDLLYWPHMNKEIEDMIKNCDICLQYQKSHSFEPLTLREVPDKPWNMVGADMFFFNNKIFLLVVDYLTKYIELCELKNQSAEEHIKALKSTFARWGIPELLYTDDGSQYRSSVFIDFCQQYGFKHKTSTPYYARSNGMVERHIQTVKKMLKKCLLENKDIDLAMLEYRNMSIDDNLKSPNEMMIGRQVASFLPVNRSGYESKYKKIKNYVQRKNESYKMYHDRKHKGKGIKFYNEQNVYIRNRNKNRLIPGKIVRERDNDRNYEVLLENGRKVIRNRYHIFKGSKYKKFNLKNTYDYDDEDLDCIMEKYAIQRNIDNDDCNNDDCNNVDSDIDDYYDVEQVDRENELDNEQPSRDMVAKENELDNEEPSGDTVVKSKPKRVTFNLDHDDDGGTRSRSGRVIRKPDYLNDYF